MGVAGGGLRDPPRCRAGVPTPGRLGAVQSGCSAWVVADRQVIAVSRRRSMTVVGAGRLSGRAKPTLGQSLRLLCSLLHCPAAENNNQHRSEDSIPVAAGDNLGASCQHRR